MKLYPVSGLPYIIHWEQEFEIRMNHRRNCAKVARLLAEATDEKVKRFYWNKFKSL